MCSSDLEVASLRRVVQLAERERPEMPMAYKLMFSDLKQRVTSNASRETLRVAASALLALATPQFSSFMLNLVLEPFYAASNKPEIVEAIREEARRRP